MNTTGQARTRYGEYLIRFGIRDSAAGIVEIRDLELEALHCFGWSGSGGLRLKAIITPDGLVSPGWHTGDDWKGFLTNVPSAVLAARSLAWLNTDRSTASDGLPAAALLALTDGVIPEKGVDPAIWDMVSFPYISTESNESFSFKAWFMREDLDIPWLVRIQSRPGTTIIEQTSADSLLTTTLAAQTGERARRLLIDGTPSQMRWALRQLDRDLEETDWHILTGILSNPQLAAGIQQSAASLLARCKTPEAIDALANTLQNGTLSETRKACAQALGRCTDSKKATQALEIASGTEKDIFVRLEIVHALASQQLKAISALAQITKNDPESLVRDLACSYLSLLTVKGG